MNTTADAAQIIQNLADHTLEYALLLAAIGTISMAFIEVFKGVFSLRKHFHRSRVTSWIGDTDCLNELLLLAAGNPESADVFYDQPTERMMGQIQASANLALDFPDRYKRVYAFFTSLPKSPLFVALVGEQAGADDSATWAKFAVRVASDGELGFKDQPDPSREAHQARVRLGNLVARRLDVFQSRTQYQWAWYNQIAGFVVGAGLTVYAITSQSQINDSRDFVAVVGLSLLAGVLAPFAKDLVSALSSVKAKN
jgi:hypothetical protein